MELNIRQKKVVNATENNILCLSTAACGKTRIVIERIKRLLDDGADPKAIVAISFTNMAAEEMRRRIGEKGDGMFIGTIHSYANSICRLNNIDLSQEIAKEQFDKILTKALIIPDKKYPKVKHLFVDEFQDTTQLEYNFLEKIQTENRFYVGDARQFIYGFKGCSDVYLTNLHKDLAWTKYYLVENYRCRKNIMDFADSLIASEPKLSPPSVSVKPDGEVYECPFSDALEELEYEQNYGEWFVLARTNAEVEEAISRLEADGVPCMSFRKGDLSLAEMENFLKSNTVKVLTIHTAKGLEAKNVICIGARKFNADERRIAYVGATRAEDCLYWCPTIVKKRTSTKGATRYQATKAKTNMVKF